MQTQTEFQGSRTRTDRILRALTAFVLIFAGTVAPAPELSERPAEGEVETDSINPALFQAEVDATPTSLTALLPPQNKQDRDVTTLSSGDGRVCVLHCEDFRLRSLTSVDGGATFAGEVDVAGTVLEPEVIRYRATIGADDRIHVALWVADPAGGLGLRYVRSDDLGLTWTSPTTLVTGGVPSFPVWNYVLSANGSGVVAIAYTSDRTGGTHLAYSLDGGNSWPEVAHRVDLADAGSSFRVWTDTAVLVDGSGNIHVAYVQDRGAGPRVYVRRRSSIGAWSAEGPTGANLPLEDSRGPSFTEAADGGILLAYWPGAADPNATAGSVSYAVLRSVDAGDWFVLTLQAAPVVDLGTALSTFRLTTDSATATVLLSYERGGSTRQLRLRRSSNFGRTFGAETTLGTSVYGHSVARSSGGVWAVAWISPVNDTYIGVTTDVFLRSSDDDGITFGPEHRVTPGPSGRKWRGWSAQMVATDGGFLVVYLASDGQADVSDVFANATPESPIGFASDYRIDTDDGLEPPAFWNAHTNVATDGVNHVYAAFVSSNRGLYNTVYVAVSPDQGKTFGAPVAIGASANGERDTIEPIIAATPDGHVYLAYRYRESSGVWELRFNSSSDFGQTWQASDQVLGTPGGDPYPSLAVLPGGKVWVVWNSAGEVFLSRSTDGGMTFVTEDVDQNTDLTDGRARVCAQGDQVVLSWGGERTLGSGDFTMWGAISNDGGVSFNPRVDLVSDTDIDPGEGASFLRMECDGSDRAVVVWQYLKDGEQQLRTARYDGGSWSSDSPIPPPVTPGTAFTNVHPRLAFTDEHLGQPSKLLVVYEAATPASENLGVYLNASTDGGATFSPAVRLDSAAPEPGFDSFDPRVAADGYGNVWVSWMDHSASRAVSSLALRRSTDGGASFGPAVRIDRQTQGSFVNVYGLRTETAALREIGFFIWSGWFNDAGAGRLAHLFLADDRSDDDTDGVNGSLDCDDTDPDVYPGAPQLCDGVNNDCDDTSWPEVPAIEADADSDGSRVCHGDCDDTDPDTHPGAPEINDGQDNQCAGDPGYGVLDEISGDSGFHDPGDRTRYSWTPQTGATQYQVARSGVADFSTDCVTFTTSDTFWIDTALPVSGGIFHYLTRPTAPHLGSWGERSPGVERTGVCP